MKLMSNHSGALTHVGHYAERQSFYGVLLVIGHLGVELILDFFFLMNTATALSDSPQQGQLSPSQTGSRRRSQARGERDSSPGQRASWLAVRYSSALL